MALGNDRSEMLCTPDELIDRLDAYGPGTVALYEIVRWYEGAATRREDERLLDLEERALRGDQNANRELNTALAERAERRGTAPERELQRLRAKRKSRLPVGGSEPTKEQRVSIKDRMRKKADGVS